MRIAAIAAAATAAVLGFSTTEPEIMLVDNSHRLQPGDDTPGQDRTPFDVADPAIGRLEPTLLTAIQQAATAAATDGVTVIVNSGWRSPEFQQQLLDDAVVTYGSFAAARQYVQTPTGSRHVLGRAVDIGGSGASDWLIAHGARFGLCQIYANEPWHFELATDDYGHCPPLLANAAG